MSASLFFELDADLTLSFQRINDIETDTLIELKKVARGFASRNIKTFFEKHRITLPYLRFIAMCAYFEFYKKHLKMLIRDEIPLDYFIIEIIEEEIKTTKTKSSSLATKSL